jgi:hypothetical protein
VLRSRPVLDRPAAGGEATRCTPATTFTGTSTLRTVYPPLPSPLEDRPCVRGDLSHLGIHVPGDSIRHRNASPVLPGRGALHPGRRHSLCVRSTADGSTDRAQLGFGWDRGHASARGRQRWRRMGRTMGPVRAHRTDRRHGWALDGSLRLAVRWRSPPEQTLDGWARLGVVRGGAADELDRGGRSKPRGTAGRSRGCWVRRSPGWPARSTRGGCHFRGPRSWRPPWR